MHKVGTPIDGDLLLTITEIEDIIPVKWDGMNEHYVVCTPSAAQFYVIKLHGNKEVFISADCKNKELLIDIV